jgi:hypothetical protein
VYEWDGASARVVPAEPRGDLPGEPGTLGIEPYAGGHRLLILRESPKSAGKDRRRKEGRALILDASGAAPRRMHEVPFDGRPGGSALSPDGSRAYVLAFRVPQGGEEGAGRSWIHEIDLTAGRLLGSAHLPAAAAGVAVQADGRRVFVSLADRIQSFTTNPLIGSWHYRSPGPNRDLVVRPDDGTLCVARGEEVALFNPAAIATRSHTDRRSRIDDASAVIPLPFRARGLVLSGDGRLAAVRGPDRLAFLDCAMQSLIWPADPPGRISAAEEIRALAFPGAGRDLILALFPAGDVVGFRTPAVPESSLAPAPAAVAPPVPAAVPGAFDVRDPVALPGPALGASPGRDSMPAGDGPALGGRVTGDRSRVGAIVLYGPDSIVKEHGRVRPDADGRWRAPLPPPGTYRLVAVGDGPAPLAVSPPFMTIKVRAGEAQSALDFDIRGGGPAGP